MLVGKRGKGGKKREGIRVGIGGELRVGKEGRVG